MSAASAGKKVIGKNKESPQVQAFTNASPSNSIVTVNVTTCGVPEAFAQVSMLDPDGPDIDLQPNGTTGTYQLSVASGPLADVSTMIKSLPSPFGTFCGFVNGLNTYLSEGATGITLRSAL
jgi:hypothetical protein